MGYTPEQIEEAARLAENIVRQSGRVGKLEDLNSPQEAIDLVREASGERLAELLDNPLAEKLIPQARVILLMRNMRKVAIEETLLGKLSDKIIDRNLKDRSENDDLEDQFLGMPFDDALEQFISALDAGDKALCIDALSHLLILAVWDIVITDLPSVPPPYQIPE